MTRAEAKVALEPGAAQVEIPVPEAQHLVGLDSIVDRDGRRLGGIEHLQLRGGDLDLARRQVRVDRALGPRPYRAVDPHDVLGAHVMHVGATNRLRVDDHLHDARCITHVEEHDAAMVAPARHPTADDDGGADVAAAELTCEMRAHHSAASRCSRSQPTS